jgi:hypothetical protein
MGPAALAEQLWFRTEKPRHLGVGYQDREKNTPMKSDAIFRLTKPIVSVAAMTLVLLHPFAREVMGQRGKAKIWLTPSFRCYRRR